MTASTDLREALAEGFDVLSDEFQSGATVKLLKESPTSDVFTEIRTITSKRFFEYLNFRKNTLLEIADTSSQLTTDIQSATHASIDAVVYVIAQGDTLPPSGTDPVWKLFLELPERRQQYATL